MATSAPPEIKNAYAGRLGHSDPHYRDARWTDAKELGPQGQPHSLLQEGSQSAPAPAPAPAAPEPSGEAEVTEAPAAEPEGEDLEGFTVAELKEELDALGIEYDPKARKADLIELVRQAESDS